MIGVTVSHEGMEAEEDSMYGEVRAADSLLRAMERLSKKLDAIIASQDKMKKTLIEMEERRTEFEHIKAELISRRMKEDNLEEGFEWMN